jgi:hypothetical protein
MALGMIGFLATACARAASTSPQASNPSVIGPGHGYGGTVTIGPQDDGKSVILGAGDILVFSISNASPSSRGLVYRLVSYPKDLITLISGSAAPPFRFRALHQGTGVLQISFGPACGGPGPPPASQACPLSDNGIATRLLTFHLKVLARGQ